MLNIRNSEERGKTKLNWLDSRHTFSFGEYYDPKYMGFSDLRVINDDVIEPGGGFATHSHRDMEIVTYVLDGALEHKDSLGNGSIIRAGDVQRMSAGTGITHSEFNPSHTEPGHILQIWILPRKKGLTPGYEQKYFSDEMKQEQWCLLASPTGERGSVTVHQDVYLYSTLLQQGSRISYAPQPDRLAWVHVAKGAVTVNNEQRLQAGDGASISMVSAIDFSEPDERTEILLFDLRM